MTVLLKPKKINRAYRFAEGNLYLVRILVDELMKVDKIILADLCAEKESCNRYSPTYRYMIIMRTWETLSNVNMLCV